MSSMEDVVDDNSDVEIVRAADSSICINDESNLCDLFNISVPKVEIPSATKLDIRFEHDYAKPFPVARNMEMKNRLAHLSSTPVLFVPFENSDFVDDSPSISAISSRLYEGTLDFGLQQFSRFVNSEEIRNYSSFSVLHQTSALKSIEKFSLEDKNGELNENIFSDVVDKLKIESPFQNLGLIASKCSFKHHVVNRRHSL